MPTYRPVQVHIAQAAGEKQPDLHVSLVRVPAQTYSMSDHIADV